MYGIKEIVKMNSENRENEMRKMTADIDARIRTLAAKDSLTRDLDKSRRSANVIKGINESRARLGLPPL